MSKVADFYELSAFGLATPKLWVQTYGIFQEKIPNLVAVIRSNAILASKQSTLLTLSVHRINLRSQIFSYICLIFSREKLILFEG